MEDIYVLRWMEKPLDDMDAPSEVPMKDRLETLDDMLSAVRKAVANRLKTGQVVVGFALFKELPDGRLV